MTDPFEEYIERPWTADAACRDTTDGGDYFFPEGKGVNYNYARRICAACPVIDQCRDFIMSTEKGQHRYGLWAGLSPEERSQLARERAA